MFEFVVLIKSMKYCTVLCEFRSDYWGVSVVRIFFSRTMNEEM